eukprot:7153231-Pyramimonas_sp.AAC.1
MGRRARRPAGLDDRLHVFAARQVEHLLDCITRVVRCLFGESALADEKISRDVPLGILGLRRLLDFLSSEGMARVPLPEKIDKWAAHIQAALDSGTLRAGVDL